MNFTVAQVISNYNEERPNDVDDRLKLRWVKRVDHMILNETILTHKIDIKDTPLGDSMERLSDAAYLAGSEKLTPSIRDIVSDYLETYGMDTKVLVPEPYDDLYEHYIGMKIAENANDTKRYNTEMTLYNNEMLTYQQVFNRAKRPNKERSHLFQHRWL